MKKRTILSAVFMCILMVSVVGNIGGAASMSLGRARSSVQMPEANENVVSDEISENQGPRNHIVPDPIAAFDQLTNQGEWQGVYPNNISYAENICTCTPADACLNCPYLGITDACCKTSTIHFQGVARHPGTNSPEVFYLTRAGDPGNELYDSEGVLWIAEVYPSIDTGPYHGERIGSTRLKRNLETQDTINEGQSFVVRSIEFTENLISLDGRYNYNHPGGIQAVGDVLAVALAGRNDDSLPKGKVVFFDISDPTYPWPIERAEIELPHKAAFVGLAFHPVFEKYVAVVGAYGDLHFLEFYMSTTDDFNDRTFEFEFYGSIGPDELEELEDQGFYQMTPEPQSMNIIVGEDDHLYIIGAANTHKWAPIYVGENRMWLWEIGFPFDGVTLYPKAKADKRLSSYGDIIDVGWACNSPVNNLAKQEANFSAGSGAYVTPTGELLYYGTSYWNLGVGRLTRMAELRSKYVSSTKTCGAQLRDDHLGGPYWIPEGSQLTFSRDVHFIEPWVHMYDAEDFQPGNNVMMDWAGYSAWLDDYRDFSKLDGEGNGFKNKMSSFRFCGHPGVDLEIFDGTPSSSGDWEEAKKANDGWIQCEGTGEVIEVPNLSPSGLGDHCRHLDSQDSDDFDGDADSARFYVTDSWPAGEWRVEGDSGASLEYSSSSKGMEFTAGPGNYTVFQKYGDKEVSADIEVYHNPPEIISWSVTPEVPDEGEQVTVSATWQDSSSSEVNAKVDWGDGQVSDSSYACSDCSSPYSGTVELSHVYTDNGEYQVEVCFDNDLNDLEDNRPEVCESQPVTVNNVAPILALTGSVIDENGTATVNGTITDPGTQDTFEAVIDWDEGSPVTYNYGAGMTSFSETHQYLDDNPTGTPSDVYNIDVTVTDDDLGIGTASTKVTVNNVDPVTRIDSIIDETGEAIGTGVPIVLTHTQIDLGGSFTDVGTKDTFKAAIDWDDGSSDYLGSTAGSISASHVYTQPRDYIVLLEVTDDDTGVGQATASITVVDAAGAIEELVGQLQALAADPSLDPAAIDAINDALDHLIGKKGGQAADGALDMLAKGNLNAALVKMWQAMQSLEAAEAADTALTLTSKNSLLALTAKSAAMTAIVEAKAAAKNHNQMRKIKDAFLLIDEADNLLAANNYIAAVDTYRAAAQEVQGIVH